MTADAPPREEPPRRRLRVRSARLVVAVLLVAGTVLGGVAFASGAVLAQETTTPTATPNESVSEKAPYYTENATVANESWLEGRENATLPNVAHMASRFGGFIVGDDVTAQGDGPGSAGPLLVAAIVGGMLLGAVAGAGVGFVGGGVLAVVTVSLLTTMNVAPGWMYGVLLFAIGAVLASVIKGVLR